MKAYHLPPLRGRFNYGRRLTRTRRAQLAPSKEERPQKARALRSNGSGREFAGPPS